jgi:hypothetical protein
MIQNKTQVETVNFRLYFKVIFRQNEVENLHYSLNMRLVLNHILNSQDVLSFRNLFFTLFFKLSAGHGFLSIISVAPVCTRFEQV